MEFDQSFLNTVSEFWPSLRIDPQIDMQSKAIMGYMLSDEDSVFIFIWPYNKYSLDCNGVICHLNYQFCPGKDPVDDLHFWALSSEETICKMIDLLDWYQ